MQLIDQLVFLLVLLPADTSVSACHVFSKVYESVKGKLLHELTIMLYYTLKYATGLYRDILNIYSQSDIESH